MPGGNLCFSIGTVLLIYFVVILLLTCVVMVLQLPAETLLDHVLEAPGLQEWFEGSTEVGNPDALLLALKLREKISVDRPIFGKLLPDSFSPSKLFSANHLPSLANCLKVIFLYTYLLAATQLSKVNIFVLCNMAGIDILSASSSQLVACSCKCSVT